MFKPAVHPVAGHAAGGKIPRNQKKNLNQMLCFPPVYIKTTKNICLFCSWETGTSCGWFREVLQTFAGWWERIKREKILWVFLDRWEYTCLCEVSFSFLLWNLTDCSFWWKWAHWYPRKSKTFVAFLGYPKVDSCTSIVIFLP